MLMSAGCPQLNLATVWLHTTLLKHFTNILLKVISSLHASKFGPSFETCSQVKKCMAFGDCPPDMIDMLFPETLLNILEEK